MTPLSCIRNNLVDLVYKPPALSRDTIGFQLDALQQAIDEMERVRNQLNAVGSAMELVLQLLDSSHDKALKGDRLHCLLAPLQAKLSQSLKGLDEVL